MDVDYETCVCEANEFLTIAEICADNIGKLLCETMYPFAVNVSFSCELFLKAIMIYRSVWDKSKAKHHLKILFEALDADDQNSIRELYEKREKKSLDDLLLEDGNSFIEWRYAFEAPVNICVSGMLAFAEALQEYVLTFDASKKQIR